MRSRSTLQSTFSAAMAVLVVAGTLGFATQSAWAGAPADVSAAELAGYTQVYGLAIQNGLNYNSGVPYAIDNSASVGYYDRIGYYYELQPTSGTRQWVWTSMDAFDTNPKYIGVPGGISGIFRQQPVGNLNVESNTVANRTGVSTGLIEFWGSNYNGNGGTTYGSDPGRFDWWDGGGSAATGHGSMQVHDYATPETLFGFNGLNQGGHMGIGNENVPGTGNTDWTFGPAASSFSIKNLEVWVHEAGGLPTAAAAGITANAPEASTFTVVYELPIQNGAFNRSQYAQDNSAFYPDSSFDRVAYYLELDHPTFGSQFAYVSMDAFTNQADQLGVPKAITNPANAIQQFLSNMNVISDVPGVVNGTGITTGNIEFWGTNYGTGNSLPVPGANGGTFDFGDQPTPGGHGSMQIHNYGAGQTIFAFNNWNSSTPALGIGNNPSGNPDWTFRNISNEYTVKNLWVLAEIAGAALTEVTPGSGGSIDFGLEVGANQPQTIAGAVTLQNTGVTNSLIDVSGYTVTGADAGFFDVTGFAPTLLQAGFGDTAAFDVTFLGGNESRDYSALLTFLTSQGDVSYGLSAFVVPEPAGLVLLGLGTCLLLPLRRRRRG